jgi:hypothetical protein
MRELTGRYWVLGEVSKYVEVNASLRASSLPFQTERASSARVGNMMVCRDTEF